MKRNLILASASPRRKQLLALLGVAFEQKPSAIDEAQTKATAATDLAQKLALLKAKHVAAHYPGSIILGADTLVLLQKRILGKPKNSREAFSMLKTLRGRQHQVITAVAMLTPNKKTYAAYALSKVFMRSYQDDEIKTYIAGRGCFDKAGGYGVQDRYFNPVARIEGCACNVMGLPLYLTAKLLRRGGIKIKPRRYKIPCSFCKRRISLTA